MVTLGDVIAALRASLERLPFTELADALDAAEEARSLIEQVAEGSSQAELHQVVEWFGQVVAGIDELQRKLSAIHSNVTDVANRLEGSGQTSEPLVTVGRVASRLTGGMKPRDELRLGGFVQARRGRRSLAH